MDRHPPHGPARSRRAFTLVEVLIVVVILGIMAAIVVPQFAGATDESRRGAFIAEVGIWMDAMELYQAREGRWPSDGSSGVCPPELFPYLDENDFQSGTPVGGVWDTEYNDNNVTSAVGVHFMDPNDARDDAYMIVIDQIFDDGDLATGMFQKRGNDRYYAILAD